MTRNDDSTTDEREDTNTTIDRVTPVELDDPCPNCGAMFGQNESGRVRRRDPLPESIEGGATIRRMDGNLTFEVEFSCPECGQDFLVEDLTDGSMTTQ
ncbi:hypothetical protein [Halococcus sp. IIIV-5B]|uniref:hypothetical protein n=1 Tax=Halococcus sp. IIIV-5B TaxID=2321230 RepID=UPI000E72B693|nr:hypothetical protein [Halococcus sp. IIIV-5B]RJT04694.1 hypothetical protein D3261_08755 [Halococcus sp. IIIV-5B]